VTLAEFGELVAKHLGRDTAFSAAAVSRWEAGSQIPSADVIEAIAAVTGTDPGWISHGDRSAAPLPPRLPPPCGVVPP
jgi:transcriptional regulator with XRE-family HTH domain